MRGIPYWNWPQFDSAAEWLRRQGYEVISPADHDRDKGYESHPGYPTGEAIPNSDPSFHELIGWDLEQIASPGYIDALALLPGWENSSGTAMELKIARWTGKRIYYLTEVPVGGRTAWRLTEEQPATIIGLMGYAQVGKDTVGRMLVDQGFGRLAFADTLREVLYALNPLGFEDERAYAHPVRDTVDHYGWDEAKVRTGLGEYGIRAYLQRLGTEAGRKVLGENIWVDTTMNQIKPGERVVITDVRFPNEAKAIKDAGGELWRVIRPRYGPVNGHESETALDDFPSDIGIFNGGSLDALRRAVDDLVSAARYAEST